MRFKNAHMLFKAKRYTFLCFFLFCSLSVLNYQQLLAQATSVRITLVNSKNEPIPFATIKLLNIKDSSTRSKITDSSGHADVLLTKNDQYKIEVDAINYEPFSKGITYTNQTSLKFQLKPSSSKLKDVVVTSSKPLMKQEDDKTIVDPENLAASSTNAYETIEKIPGIFMDQDGNIYLNSTTPASVYINGREMKMSTSDIATILKSLPPNAIQKIEILRTPSARYDASGGGGLVNVVLKKGIKIGKTGSVYTGFNQGRYGNQFAGVTINNNEGKNSSYINLQYAHRKSYDQFLTNRLFAADTLLQQDATTIYSGNSYFGSFGFNREVNKKWNIGTDARISYSNYDNNTLNESSILKISNSNIASNNLGTIGNNGWSMNYNQGFSSRYKIDSVGSEWTIDASYNYSRSSGVQLFNTAFKVPAITNIGGNGDIDNYRNFFSLQTDFTKKLKNNFSFETGGKTTFTSFQNQAVYYITKGNVTSNDQLRTNTFRYSENINALYVQGSKKFNGFILKVGTRLENTQMKGRQIIPTDTSFNLNRTDLFPYVYLSRKVMSIANYELRGYLVYRRTISRPGYDLLNPFPRFIDQYLFETGNPSLRPQFTQNYEANISVEDMPLLAVGVNNTKDIFTNVIYQADTSRSVAYRTYDNLGTNKETYFRITGAIPPGKRYFFVVGAQYNHNFYNGLYENQPLAFKRGSWSLFTYQTFKIDKLSIFSINGFVRINGQQQFYELENFGGLFASVNRQFMQKKLIVTLSVSDMFFTNNNRFNIKQGTVNAFGYRESDTRRFGLNIRYNFGIRKKEENTNMFNVDSPDKSN